MNKHTITSLGLNLEAAESGKLHLLLPEDYEACWQEYALPSDFQELARLALIPVNRQKSAGARYVMRCKRAYKERLKNKAAINIAAKNHEAGKRLSEIRQMKRKASVEIKKVINEVRLEADNARATLGDLYDLAHSGAKLIMEAFVKGKAIEGTTFSVTVSDFNNTMGKVFGQVAKLGVPSGDDVKTEAKEAIFEQALMEMRRKLDFEQQETVEAPIEVPGPKNEQ